MGERRRTLGVAERLDAVGGAIERPRERLLAAGAAMLPDAELIGLVLGCAGPEPAHAAALRLLGRHGSLPELSRMSPSELSRAIGAARSARLSAALELGRRAVAPRPRGGHVRSAAEVYALVRTRLAHLTREEFHVLLLDARHRVVALRRVAEGGVSACALTPRDVFEPAIREAAPAIVAIHNHPSGDPSPSQDDVVLTRRLEEAADVLGIALLYHVVVGDAGFTSLRSWGAR